MGSIPPISSVPPSSPTPSGQTMVQQIEDLIEQYRNLMQAYIDNPSQTNLDKLESCMKKIQAFLEKNHSKIDALADKLGWPTSGPNSPETFFEGTINSINNFLADPNSGSLNMVNEQLTQLHWLLTNKPPM